MTTPLLRRRRPPGSGGPGAVPPPVPGLPLGLLAPPSVPVFPDGYAPAPGDFGRWVQSTLGFCTQKICFRAHQAAAQTLTSGVLTMDTVDEDPYSGWTSGGANKWTAPWTGWYEVTVTVMSSASAIWLAASMTVTGGTRYDGDNVLCTSGNTGGATASQYVAMIGGQDYVTPQCVASGSFTTEVIVPGRCSSIEVVYLSELQPGKRRVASGDPTSPGTDLFYVNNIDGTPLTSSTPTSIEPATSTNPGPAIPSNWLNQAYGARRSARFVVRGVVSTAASAPGTLVLAVLLGSTSVAATPAFTPAVSLSNGEWELEGDLVFRSVGSAGLVQCSALLSVANSATAANAMEQIQCPANTAAGSWATAYDTTVAGTYVPVPFHIQATWSTAPAGDSITLTLLKLWADN